MSYPAWALLFSALLLVSPVKAFADADELSTSAGLQPLVGAVAPAPPYPGESRVFLRADGAYQAVPEVRGRVKIFHFVEREAPWTLRPGLTVTAKTYNGVVPGPTIVVRQGDHVVVDLLNELAVPDTLHLHGIHGGPVEMDGVGGISQGLIEPRARFSYAFDAKQSGTFIYHSHGSEDMVDAGLYGGIIVTPKTPRPEEIVSHDYLQIISAWKIQSQEENHFTLNGKSYPATKALDISPGQRIRVRWINISSENDHTMHTHGHDQLVIARDGNPLEYRDVEDTLMLGPGQRADVVIAGNAKPGTWLMHCHVLDHIEDANAMPDGLISALHYTGTPNVLSSMNDVMSAHMTMRAKTVPTNLPARPKAIPLETTLLLGCAALLSMLIGFFLLGSRTLPRETALSLHFIACAVLAVLLVKITPNLTFPLFQGMKVWVVNGPFPFFVVLALLSGLLVGLVVMVVARYRTVHDAGVLLFIQGLAVGASAASGATLLAFLLVVGFTVYNVVKGCDAAARVRLAEKTISAGNIALSGCLASIAILPGMLLGYACAAGFALFFYAIATGALMYAAGEVVSAVFILVVAGYATNAESASL